ncbi:MAG: ABC transporter permease [Eubacterium sp.]
MYIIKNALKCIGRSKGRNFLIGVIVFVIAISSCIGLSIRQAAESAKEETLSSMSVTATISFDRTSAMSQMKGDDQGFDRSSFKEMMGNASSLSLEEYQTYAQAKSVEDFYYYTTSYVNSTDGFEPVSTEDSDDEATTEEASQTGTISGFSDNALDNQGAMMGKGNKVFGSNSDFTVVGYSGENAMTAFLDGTSTITQGEIFDMDSANYECIITQDLAAYNELSVGDTVKISNPNNEEEVYSLKIVGIYTDSSANESSFSMFGSTSNDPANKIYTNYLTLEDIIKASDTAVSELTDEDSTVSALSGMLTGTYSFADVEDYEAFEAQARELGLDESYTVTSSDVTAFENSMVPLDTLSTMAGYFLIVILAIGAVILVVLNIFNIRERKYEIGVLTAMGMKKGKVALQFLTEIFIVTLIAVIIGVGAGAVSSVPVTNALLEKQVASQTSQSEQIEQNFGRGNMDNGSAPSANERGNKFSQMLGAGNENSYVTQVNSAMNMTVVLQMIAICILLTLISGAVSMLFVMRYEPLKILANRD